MKRTLVITLEINGWFAHEDHVIASVVDLLNAQVRQGMASGTSEWHGTGEYDRVKGGFAYLYPKSVERPGDDGMTPPHPMSDFRPTEKRSHPDSIE